MGILLGMILAVIFFFFGIVVSNSVVAMLGACVGLLFGIVFQVQHSLYGVEKRLKEIRDKLESEFQKKRD